MLLRRIRKSRWLGMEALSWLDASDIHADPLGDLPTKSNELSVWYVGADETNLEQVLTAIAANRTWLSNLDYALFDEQELSEIHIDIKDSIGGTPYASANVWHRDLIQLSGSKLVELAKAILKRGKIKRVMEKQTITLLVRAMNSGLIDLPELDPVLQEKLQEHLA